MALDACVYCDCLEKGRVDWPNTKDSSVEIESDGCPCLYKNGELVDYDHNDYNLYACAHTDRIFVKHHLGNIGLISLLRFELKREPSQFPILLEKVVYSGSHCGDWLSLETVKEMQVELERLRNFRTIGTKAQTGLIAALLQDFGIIKGSYVSAEGSARFLNKFREQMIELSEAALSIGKPIAF